MWSSPSCRPQINCATLTKALGGLAAERAGRLLLFRCGRRGRAKIFDETPPEEGREEEPDNRPYEISEQVAHLLDAVAEEPAQHDVEHNPQRLADRIVKEKARPRIVRQARGEVDDGAKRG